MKFRPFLLATAIPLLMIFQAGCRQQQAGERSTRSEGQNQAQEVPLHSQEESGDGELLRQAALEGRSDEVHLLLRSGIDADGTDDAGHTALMFAAYNGHTAIVEELIGSGASVDRRDFLGRSALLYASTGPFPETVKVLLDHGADPNLVDTDEHFSPLMHAAAEGHLEVVRLLIARGADPSLKDIDGDDAASFALGAGHRAVADYLNGVSQ